MLDEFQAELDADLKEQLLEAFEDDGELDKVNIEHELWVAIGNVGLWNVDFGFLDIAEQFANEYLQIAQKYKDDWNYGNAICKGNLTLGRIELRRGNIRGAKNHLILAGKTPGSSKLSTSGPNMLLVKELLEEGEKESVIEFLGLCEGFWDNDFGKLKKWKKQVSKGEIPYFGGTLLY